MKRWKAGRIFQSQRWWTFAILVKSFISVEATQFLSTSLSLLLTLTGDRVNSQDRIIQYSTQSIRIYKYMHSVLLGSALNVSTKLHALLMRSKSNSAYNVQRVRKTSRINRANGKRRTECVYMASELNVYTAPNDIIQIIIAQRDVEVQPR